MAAPIPELRIRALNEAPLRDDGSYVLYWMTAARRTRFNYALDRAVELATDLDRPLLVLEALRVGYPWASDRIHRFVLDGMADNARAFEGTGVLYHPYVEPRTGDGEGLLSALAKRAAVVVTDDSPVFFLPRMTATAARQVGVRMEGVDSNGLLPLRATDRVFARAFDFRRFLQRELAPHLEETPRRAPLRTKLRPLRRLPNGIPGPWPRTSARILDGDASTLADLPIDHAVSPVPFRGGEQAGRQELRDFVDLRLAGYGQDRNRPEEAASSGLSPYLHFGHVSPHEVLHELAEQEDWTPASVRDDASGSRAGWWRMSPGAEGFLDQLVTWRELGLNSAAHAPDHGRYESLPDWALQTLEEHAADPRPHVYSLEEFERAETHDDLWNAAQTQLREEGRIHNYLRMLWGKKILHWSESPRAAFEIMVALNDRYAIDGRDPNSTSGITWVLGRYDRAWGPERPVFGKVRYMSGANTRRKLPVKGYVERWS
jgi:deoxyribodipyrimidine photo-lyase